MTSVRRRLVAHAAVLAIVAAGAAQAAVAATSSPVAGKRDVPSARVSIASYNTASTLKTDTAVADITRLAGTGADVITLQEMANPDRRKRVVAALVDCSMCQYEKYIPPGAVPGSTPILYRWDRFRLEGSGTTQVTERTFVGAKGAGPSTLNAKFVNWVHLRERATGLHLYVLNNHAVPTVQGPSGGPNRRQPKRVELYRKHMQGLRDLIAPMKATGAAVFVTGDLNVNFRKDRVVKSRAFPFVTLGALGLRASFDTLGEPASGTHVLPGGHSSRLIDYVYSLQHGSVTPVSQAILRGYASDHRPVKVEFDLS
jgi:endonuclease/exonuclease/phosphatase family metal-dependent hydrolase